MTRGLDTIRKMLTGLSSVNMHTICSKNYTRKFNFKQHCLFCRDDCDTAMHQWKQKKSLGKQAEKFTRSANNVL